MPAPAAPDRQPRPRGLSPKGIDVHLSRSASILTAAAAAATLVVGVPTTASAQSWTHADPAGDVWKTVSNFDTETTSDPVVDPTAADHDVVSTTIRHNPRKVIATVRMRELSAPTDGLDVLVLNLRTGRGVREVLVWTGEGDARATHELWGLSGGPQRCRGLRHHLDHATATATISVPRSCLGRPRFIRANVQAIRAVTTSDSIIVGWSSRAMARRAAGALRAGSADPDISTQYTDDAMSSRDDSPVYSPRLRRG